MPSQSPRSRKALPNPFKGGFSQDQLTMTMLNAAVNGLNADETNHLIEKAASALVGVSPEGFNALLKKYPSFELIFPALHAMAKHSGTKGVVSKLFTAIKRHNPRLMAPLASSIKNAPAPKALTNQSAGGPQHGGGVSLITSLLFSTLVLIGILTAHINPIHLNFSLFGSWLESSPAVGKKLHAGLSYSGNLMPMDSNPMFKAGYDLQESLDAAGKAREKAASVKATQAAKVAEMVEMAAAGADTAYFANASLLGQAFAPLTAAKEHKSEQAIRLQHLEEILAQYKRNIAILNRKSTHWLWDKLTTEEKVLLEKMKADLPGILSEIESLQATATVLSSMPDIKNPFFVASNIAQIYTGILQEVVAHPENFPQIASHPLIPQLLESAMPLLLAPAEKAARETKSVEEDAASKAEEAKRAYQKAEEVKEKAARKAKEAEAERDATARELEAAIIARNAAGAGEAAAGSIGLLTGNQQSAEITRAKSNAASTKARVTALEAKLERDNEALFNADEAVMAAIDALAVAHAEMEAAETAHEGAKHVTAAADAKLKATRGSLAAIADGAPLLLGAAAAGNSGAVAAATGNGKAVTFTFPPTPSRAPKRGGLELAPGSRGSRDSRQATLSEAAVGFSITLPGDGSRQISIAVPGNKPMEMKTGELIYAMWVATQQSTLNAMVLAEVGDKTTFDEGKIRAMVRGVKVPSNANTGNNNGAVAVGNGNGGENKQNAKPSDSALLKALEGALVKIAAERAFNNSNIKYNTLSEAFNEATAEHSAREFLNMRSAIVNSVLTMYGGVDKSLNVSSVEPYVHNLLTDIIKDLQLLPSPNRYREMGHIVYATMKGEDYPTMTVGEIIEAVARENSFVAMSYHRLMSAWLNIIILIIANGFAFLLDAFLFSHAGRAKRYAERGEREADEEAERRKKIRNAETNVALERIRAGRGRAGSNAGAAVAGTGAGTAAARPRAASRFGPALPPEVVAQRIEQQLPSLHGFNRMAARREIRRLRSGSEPGHRLGGGGRKTRKQILRRRRSTRRA